LAEAMEQVVNYLNLPDLDQADREKGLLRKARLSLRMDKLDECRAVLKEIPEDSPEHPEATVIGGEALMREAQIARGKGPDVPEENLAQSREKYKEAIDVFRQAEEAAEMGSEAMLQAMYFIGICFMETGDFRAAFDQFTRLHKRYPDSTEGVAACLQQAELSYRAGRDMEMLSEYRRAVGGIEPSVPFHNPWISSELLKARLSDSYQHFLGQSRYEVCLQMAGLLKRLLPPEQLKLLLADLYNKWGQSLSSGADQAPRSRREPMRRLARDKLRRAGAYYIELAKMYLDTKQYTDYLWSAATVYLQGHDYRRAAGLFRDYLKNEVSRRHPQALDYLGESLLSMGDYKAALETLKECIELFPRDVAACHARILAAQAARELGDYAEAERILLANLNGDYLTPASKEWRESLFLLGDLYHLAGRYADAARRLNEIVQRYPDLPETLLSRYLLADSCRHLGMAMQDDLKKDISGSSLATQSKQIAENYARALEQYRFIVEKLGGNHDAAEMSDVEKAVLRNSYFSIGYVLFAAGDYQASVKALFAAVNRYQNRPEMFDAYVQIASAYRLLGKPDEAENALTQAKLLLARMKPETSFRETSIYSRDEWNNRLDRMLAGGS
jgi:tetratricopeptide (TPR) repeat protein